MPFTFKTFLASLFAVLFSVKMLANTQDSKTIPVTFSSEGVKLSGTILMPKKPNAAVVIVHGSGQEKRMLDYANQLADKGIAVLTYDKRGVGESGGVYAGPEVGTNNIDNANLNLLSLDASAAVTELKKYLPSPKAPIGLTGGSQAGWIIPLAAEKNKDVKFMVIFSGSLVTAKEQLRFQFYTNGNPNFWDTHSEEEARQHIFNDPDKYQFEDTDPRASLSKLKIPGLWIYGGRDPQVPAKLSMEYLDKLKLKNNRYQYQFYPILGHNTAFSKDSKEAMDTAIAWMLSQKSKNK